MAQLSSSGLCPQDECERLEAHRRELFEMQTQGRTMECVDSGALSSPHWPHLLDFDKVKHQTSQSHICEWTPNYVNNISVNGQTLWIKLHVVIYELKNDIYE